MGLFSLFPVIIFSILNRARGSQIFGLTDSTTMGRVVSSFGMAMIAGFMDIRHASYIYCWSWLTLFLWMLLGWDKYWSAEIGNDPVHSKGWGIANMLWRMALIIPYFVGLAYISGHSDRVWLAAGSLLFWAPYYIIGSFSKPHVIPWSEYIIGAMIGSLTLLIAGV